MIGEALQGSHYEEVSITFILREKCLHLAISEVETSYICMDKMVEFLAVRFNNLLNW